MDNYVILTDSSCDLPASLAKELNLTILPLSYEVGGATYQNDLEWSAMPSSAFYQLLREEVSAKTSAVSVGAYVDVIEPLLQAGTDVLILAFSSGLSNTYQASSIAVSELSAKYPERKLYTVDTLSASLGQGLLVYHAAQRKKDGMEIEAVRDWVEENKLYLCHWFTVADLNHLKRGGRISGATALFGTMLGIKPVMHMDDTGHLVNVSKARGRQAALKALVDQMEKTAVKPEEQFVFISHGDCYDDAQTVSNMVKERMGVKNTLINPVGPVIGCHSGPGTLALFFFGKTR
ncbi:MAG: DegV family protein [Oscillospiraceae bacterium]|jgi:DegV family protein with EDD domain